MADLSPRPVRGSMAPENVLILVLAALAVGLLCGNATGRRQGLVVKQVVLPAELAAQTAAAEEESAMAASAPAAPESLAAARQMVASMGQADPAVLLDLGQRKLGNHVDYLAAALFERCTQLAPEQLAGWCGLAAAQRALGDLPAARQAVVAARGRDDRHAAAWFLRGEVERDAKQPAAAAEAYAKYLELAPRGEQAAAAKQALAALRR
ncbi:MAG: hypothetical protein IT204_15245 [Fimbriimonadaceae bacterium]|nr:hypothetical protein [Fimbriimonadaceae bacterium]